MNENKKDFTKKNLFKELLLTKKEMEIYYRLLREYNYNNSNKIDGVEYRKKIHILLLKLIELQRKYIYKQSLNIISDKRKETDKPIIYACTHIGRYDIEIAMETIKKHCYLFMADPETMYRTLDGLLLNLNGVIYMDGLDKTDRNIAKLTAERLLKQNGNLLIYPEGAWNVTENEVVMKLYTGTVDLAKKTGAEIIPIAIEQYNKDFYVNVGENISLEGNTTSNRIISDDLRDTLATLKWEIWEKFSAKREDIPANYSEIFLENILKECGDYYDLQKIEDAKFRDKNVISADEVFKFSAENQDLKQLNLRR